MGNTYRVLIVVSQIVGGHLKPPYELLGGGGVKGQVKFSCPTWEMDGVRYIKSLVNVTGRIPRGVKVNNGRARLQPNTSKGWFCFSISHVFLFYWL